jgi:hypothetical protein
MSISKTSKLLQYINFREFGHRWRFLSAIW